MPRPNCIKCVYYYVTWDYSRPHGCKYFAFKSKALPSIVVYKNSHNHCQAFIDKTKN